MKTETTLTKLSPSPNCWRAEPGQLLWVAGPCSAESETQLLETAHELKALGVQTLRAGFWKPRSRPGGFEGVGAPALSWVQAVQQQTGLAVATEVATPQHLEQALAAGVSRVWIGARTTVNPFVVAELAEAMRGVKIPVLVKNPVNPDLPLWMGALERFLAVGVEDLAACHRGFSYYRKRKYRNQPQWEIPLELKRQWPNLPLLGDPSHLAGDQRWIPEIAQQMVDLGYEGLMVEVHPQPEQAKSDAAQQLTPQALAELMRDLDIREPENVGDYRFLRQLNELRAQIDELDAKLLAQMSRRMEIVEDIALLKEEAGVQPFQRERWDSVLSQCRQTAESLKLEPELVDQVLQLLHVYALRRHRAGENPESNSN